MGRQAFEVKDPSGAVVATGGNAYEAQKRAEEEATLRRQPMTVHFCNRLVAEVSPQPPRRGGKHWQTIKKG